MRLPESRAAGFFNTAIQGLRFCGPDVGLFQHPTKRPESARRPFVLCLLLLCFVSGCSGSSVDEKRLQPHSGIGSAEQQQAAMEGKAAPERRPRATDWFEDITEHSGVNFSYRNGQEAGHCYILESLGGGVAMFDYDVDGDLDLFFTGGGSIAKKTGRITGTDSALFRHDAEGRFSDVTRESGLDQPIDYSHGTAVADFNRDGYPDLFVCCYGQCRLYRNIEGGKFVECSEAAGIRTSGWCTAAAWTDIDLDGLPDLIVIRYLKWSPEIDQDCFNADGKKEVCGPGRFDPERDLLFRNRGDGSFEEVSESVGFDRPGRGLGVVATDLNSDGRIDCYVVNDESENHLYLGGTDTAMREIGAAAGVAVNEYGMHDGSMGVDVGDVNSDGRPDLWVTNFESEDNALYQNLGDCSFAQVTAKMSLAGDSRRQVGFGTALADFDGDGQLDIFVANGHVFYHGGQLPYLQQPQLFRNTGRGHFEDISEAAAAYFITGHAARGAAVGDLDNDGGLDLVIVHQNAPVTVLRNRFPMKRFVRLQVIGEQATREAIGATVTVTAAGQQTTHFVKSGAGYFSHSDQRILVPVTDNGPVDVAVAWPGGRREVFAGLTPGNITHELHQGHGSSREE
ncbi:MAG: CRTAC1 family protein [Fuerstiella sp.]